jgi:uncharacterized secreted protein with C-terminal beta-propeller domain
MFTAVRFFDNIAYAVTFEQTDPFYVLDLTNPETPVVLGELEILGFSSYLHSINSENTKLLAVGRQATANGTVQGLKIRVGLRHFWSCPGPVPLMVQVQSR